MGRRLLKIWAAYLDAVALLFLGTARRTRRGGGPKALFARTGFWTAVISQAPIVGTTPPPRHFRRSLTSGRLGGLLRFLDAWRRADPNLSSFARWGTTNMNDR